MVATSRDRSMDSIKFILIVLVILGHVLGSIDRGAVAEAIYKFIYSFHMPAFVLISGYFFKKNSTAAFLRKESNLLFIYLFFNILSPENILLLGLTALKLVKGEILQGGVIINILQMLSKMYIPTFGLWYIFALIVWRVFLQCIPKRILNHTWLCLILSIFFSLLSTFSPLVREFSFQRIFGFFPFFLMGYYINRYDFMYKLRSVRKWIPISVMIFYLGVTFFTQININTLTLCYNVFDNEGSLNLLYRLWAYFWMLPLVFAFLSIAPNVELFVKEGGNTLFYYIYHLYILQCVIIVVSHYHIQGNIIIALGISFLIIISLKVLSKIKILYPPLNLGKSVKYV